MSRPYDRAVRVAALALVPLLGWDAADAQSSPALRSPAPTPRTTISSLVFASPPPATVADGFVYAVLGDISQVKPVTGLGLPQFDEVLKVVRGTDFVLANQEGPAFHTATKKFAVNETGAMFPEDTTAPWDIRNMGVKMVTVANNHGMDYGADALFEDLRLLEAAGLAYAGAGANLREARAATLFATPKGRVTVVATAGTFKPNFVAADGRGALAERAGISTVRTTEFQQVTAPEMKALVQLKAMRAPGSVTQASADAPPPEQLSVLDQVYRLGDKPGLSFRINEFDLKDIMQAVHTAKQNSDFTIFTIHAHQSETGEDDTNPRPADYLVQLFHSVVDAGADVVAGHGNHLIRGIEIYRGKPIFYGLASFAFSGQPAGTSVGGEPRLLSEPGPSGPPSDQSIRRLGNGVTLTMWESIFATTRWKGGQLEEIRVYPIDLTAAGNKPKGVPAFASPDVGRKILNELKRDSEQFGTHVEIEGNVAVIRP
ncbi:MAG TPA: CapA family protein [Gemmatimonadaceae bacterium]|nr:CapA family protein [Gemmatimonadaceae bacterium]